MKKSEKMIIMVIFAIAVISYGFFHVYRASDPSDIIQVIHHDEAGNQEVILEFDANVDSTYTIDVELGQMTIEVKDGYYHVSQVDCPNHNCEKMGYVNSESVMNVIICMPNGISIQPKEQGDD